MAEKLQSVGYSMKSKGYGETTSEVFIRSKITFNETDFCHQAVNVEQQNSMEESIDSESEVESENSKRQKGRWASLPLAGVWQSDTKSIGVQGL